MNYTQEQRHKAEVVAHMIHNCVFDGWGYCKKAKNGVYFRYDYAEDCTKPVSIGALAEDYDAIKASGSYDEQLEEAEMELKT